MNRVFTCSFRHRSILVTLSALGIIVAGILDVPAPAHADTFRIEIDYMVENGPMPHSHMPQPDEIQEVVNMFACAGHTLIVEVSDAIPHYDVMPRNPSTGAFFSYDGVPSGFRSLRNTFFDHAGDGGWHYGIFGHRYGNPDGSPSGSSGLAEGGGDDFVVTLGGFSGEIGTSFDRAATLAHEFGHNLGLSHCGEGYCGSDNEREDYVGPRPENLPSVMSYFFQLRSVRAHMICQGLTVTEASRFRNIDYSHGTMCDLDENNLNEVIGTRMNGVDWSCDDIVAGVVAMDLNASSASWCGGGTGARTVLSDYDEWANIQDSAKWKTAEQLDEAPEISCITAEEWEHLKAELECGQPSFAVEGCPQGDMIYVNPSGNVSSVGKCTDPFDTVVSAHGSAAAGSVLILEPATYDESGVVVLNKRINLYSRGTVVVK